MNQLESNRQLYQLLGLEEGATIDEVRKAYRLKAVKYHPDKNPDDEKAAEMFKSINHSHQVLTDPVKKKKYDDRGRSDAVQFASKAYNSTSYRETENQRKAREQELYRKRAARDPVKQGEARRSGSTTQTDTQRDYWRTKDHGRNKELASKLAREKEQTFEKEVERQRNLEASRVRAEEGRRREADRVMTKQREKDAERQKQLHAELQKRERVEGERIRQDDARKRELSRQIKMKQRQAEKLKEQRALEAEQKIVKERETEVTDFFGEEQQARRVILFAQSKARAQYRDHCFAQQTDIGNREELMNIENDEVSERLNLDLVFYFANEFIVGDIYESQCRCQISDQWSALMHSIKDTLLQTDLYWNEAYDKRRLLEHQHQVSSDPLRMEERSARETLQFFHEELCCRKDISTIQDGLALYLTDVMSREMEMAKSRTSFYREEFLLRSFIAEQWNAELASLGIFKKSIQLITSEQQEREDIITQSDNGIIQEDIIRKQKVVAENERQKDSLMEQQAERIRELESQVSQLKQDSSALVKELTVTTQTLSSCQEEAHQTKLQYEKKFAALFDENKLLKQKAEAATTPATQPTAAAREVKRSGSIPNRVGSATYSSPSTPVVKKVRSSSHRPSVNTPKIIKKKILFDGFDEPTERRTPSSSASRFSNNKRRSSLQTGKSPKEALKRQTSLFSVSNSDVDSPISQSELWLRRGTSPRIFETHRRMLL